MTNIGLVDDHRIVLDGLKRLVESVPQWRVIVASHCGQDMLDLLDEAHCDILVVDLRMPIIGGLELTRRVRSRFPEMPVVILTADIGDFELAEAMRLGTKGIVLKEEAHATFIECLKEVLDGRTYFFQAGTQSALSRLGSAGYLTPNLTVSLTAREFEIARLASDGWKTRSIGEKLSISPGTVKIHLHNIYEKLGVTTRVELTNSIRCYKDS